MLDTILEITLSMSMVIVAVLFLSPVIEKRYSARWRYFVWLIIAIRLVIPFNVTLPEAPINVQTPMANVYVGINSNTTEFPHVDVKEEMPTPNDDISEENSVVLQESTNNKNKVPLIDIVENIWMAGAILFIGYHLLNYGLFRKAINKDATVIDIEMTKALQKEMNIECLPRIITSENVLSPMLIGFIKPLVILPHITYSEQELNIILKHELMHYKRHDLWYKLLLIIANGMHWFNPIVYIMVKKANRDLEHACDDDVVKNEELEYRKDYSRVILESMERSLLKQNA